VAKAKKEGKNKIKKTLDQPMGMRKEKVKMTLAALVSAARDVLPSRRAAGTA